MNRSFRRATRGSLIATLCLGLAGAVGCQTPRSGAPPTPSQSASSEVRAPVATTPTTAALELETVYFDLGRWELRDDARNALKQNARELQQSESWNALTIEGHCDERGSEEYNMALGARRAEVVARYLKDLGVPAARLTTQSFGEDRPAVQGHDESAWQRNRRAELRLAPQQQASR